MKNLDVVSAVKIGVGVGILLVWVLWPMAALAQDAGVTPVSSVPLKDQVLSALVTFVLLPIITAAGGLLVMVLKHLHEYLIVKGNESKAALLSSKMVGAVASVVAELNATLRPQLEAALADGVLTDTEKKALKDAALELLKTKLPGEMMAALTATFGSLTDAYLGGLIEREVLNQKATAAIGASRPS